MNKPVLDLRRFRFRKLNTDEFRHMKWILFWPLFGLSFYLIERIYQPASFHIMYTRLDDLIPFCEWFLPFYLFWFLYLAGSLLYLLFYDPKGFTREMKFITITFSLTVLICIFYPNCQELRPDSFARDNVLTRFIAGLYKLDTSTNVFPSMHVIGSAACMFGLTTTKRFRSTGWKIFWFVITVLVSISTVFLKQHSVLDIFGAIPVCILGYLIVYIKPIRRN